MAGDGGGRYLSLEAEGESPVPGIWGGAGCGVPDGLL